MSGCGHAEYWLGNYGPCMACRAEKAESERNQLKESILRHEEVGVRQNKEIERLKAQLQKATSDHCMDVFVPIEKWEKIQSQLAVAREALETCILPLAIINGISTMRSHCSMKAESDAREALSQLSDARGNK
jgi:hypothetical protein